MATHLQNLITRRDAIGAELAGLNRSAAGGLPNHSGGSPAVDHTGYIDRLYRELDRLNREITLHQGGFSVPMQGDT